MQITDFLSLLGGLALFLYGMQMMGSGLEAAAGNKMKRILERLTSNRFMGVAVGAGVGVKLGDPSAMLDEDLVEKMLRCCEENHIPYQRDVMDRGGTDSSSINRSGCGVRVCGISLVDRYAHSQSSVISWDDLQAALELIDKYTALHFEFPDPVLFERKPQ